MLYSARVACSLAAIASASTICLAQAIAQDREVASFSCKEVMREDDSNREASIAFLHGYLMGKAGSDKVNLDTMAKQTDAFINRCLDNPTETALNAMTAAKK